MTINIGAGSNEQPNKPAAPQPVAAKPVAAPQVAKPIAPAQPQQPRTNPQPQTGNSKMNNLMTQRNQSYGMSRAATSDAMRQIMETVNKLSEAEENNTNPTKFTYITVDGEKEGMKISSVIVVATPRTPTDTNRFAAHHTLLVAATNKADSRKEMQTSKGNLRYERVIIPGEAYDKKLSSRVEQIVQTAFPGYTLIDADTSVVPTLIDLKSDLSVRNIVANATSAAGTLLAGQINNDGWMITPEATNAFTFRNEIKSSFDPFCDLAGNPVRADIVAELSYSETKGNRGNDNNEGEFSFNNGQSRELISQITGYLDIASCPPSTIQPMMIGVQQHVNPNDYKINAARMVITNIDTPAAAGELPVVIQALGTLQVLQNNGMWKNVLLKQYKDGAANPIGGTNIRDLSAIGLEAPVMPSPLGFTGAEPQKAMRLPLNSAAINDASALAAINTYFIDQMLFSMDVEESGPSSWMLSVFVACARGDMIARQDIFEASDMLTNTKFTEIYKALNNGSMPSPVFNDNQFVDLGYYETPRGQRDKRDVDHLAVLNATGDTELETINDWANLQANAELDAMFRLAETRKIVQSLMPSVHITGRAVRVTFRPSFIYAIAQAVAEAGLSYDTDMSIAQPQSTTRMVAPYMNNLQSLGNAGGFVQGGMNRGDARGVSSTSFGRYASQQAQQQTGGSNF